MAVHFHRIPKAAVVAGPGFEDSKEDYRRADQVTKALSNIAGAYEIQHMIGAYQAQECVITGAIDFITDVLMDRDDGMADARDIARMIVKHVADGTRRSDRA